MWDQSINSLYFSPQTPQTILMYVVSISDNHLDWPMCQVVKETHNVSQTTSSDQNFMPRIKGYNLYMVYITPGSAFVLWEIEQKI